MTCSAAWRNARIEFADQEGRRKFAAASLHAATFDGRVVVPVPAETQPLNRDALASSPRRYARRAVPAAQTREFLAGSIQPQLHQRISRNGLQAMALGCQSARPHSRANWRIQGAAATASASYFLARGRHHRMCPKLAREGKFSLCEAATYAAHCCSSHQPAFGSVSAASAFMATPRPVREARA